MYALVKSSDDAHIAVTRGIPRPVVLAAPQKQTAIVCSFGRRRSVKARRRLAGKRPANVDSPTRGLTAFMRNRGGLAA